MAYFKSGDVPMNMLQSYATHYQWMVPIEATSTKIRSYYSAGDFVKMAIELVRDIGHKMLLANTFFVLSLLWFSGIIP